MIYPELTKADKWLVSLLLLLSTAGIILSFTLFPAAGGTTAQVQIDGKLYKTVPLRPGYSEEFRIGGQTEYAVIEVRDDKIRIRQDDSPRQIGVRTGWISRPPQQIVNLPYRILITIESNEKTDIDAITN
ncbi:Hypothetical protein LUCI_4390 [Lucifera butyrica]|uniref:Uncharacterized protein n=1 Tax=Lucifera butyrica TaxID=1351585 RepID=A0A498RC55_9FIRM|nr:NusG domain II-containing protein [Lucifera butyrica]VBB09104.1 Hypothetical protein LUCI_4390 [Lucifera butyrica]